MSGNAGAGGALGGNTACGAHDLMLTIALPEWVAADAYPYPYPYPCPCPCPCPEPEHELFWQRGSMGAKSHHGITVCRVVGLSSCRLVGMSVPVPTHALHTHTYTQIDSLLIKKPSKMALARALQHWLLQPCHWQLCSGWLHQATRKRGKNSINWIFGIHCGHRAEDALASLDCRAFRQMGELWKNFRWLINHMDG